MGKKVRTIFFGTPKISVYFLEKAKSLGFSPDLIITNPDKFSGRKKILTPPPVKLWAEENKIPYLQPQNLYEESFLNKIKNYNLFFVFAYNKILKKEILEIPNFGILNLHPSLLPKYRGPSPIISALLGDEKNTGLSIIRLDEKMDSGPIVFQKKIKIENWQKNNILEKFFAENGAEAFVKMLPDFLEGKIKEKKQENENATYCKKFEKKDMEIFSSDDEYLKWRKFLAFSKSFFMGEVEKRFVVTDAEFSDNKFLIKKVIPEGKKETDFKKDFLK